MEENTHMRKSAGIKWQKQMNALLRKTGFTMLAGSLALTAACSGGAGNNTGTGGTASGTVGQGAAHGGNGTHVQSLQGLGASGTGQGPRIMSGGQAGTLLSDGSAAIPITPRNGMPYVSLNEIADALEYFVEYDEETMTVQVGDFGPFLELKINSTEASKDDESITLPGQVLYTSGKTFIPLAAVAQLFTDDMSYSITEKELNIQPSGVEVSRANMDGPDDVYSTGDLDFEDDPNDPFKGEDDGSATIDHLPVWIDNGQEHEALEAALKNININNLIRTSRKYLGVKYKFGAKPYPQSGRFDCSTYTRYIYGKYGVSLPRTARSQAKRGNKVSRKSLQKGDLMYFYVPGRFKSNKVVGHVGIYIGGKKMIHASPQPKNGVQISSINKAYWKKTFLFAKRVAR
jgi:cell wall-associated NlpC family hydrolase